MTAVAVCFLHAYLNPVHEQRAKDLLVKQLQSLMVCTSSEVLPEIREYERFSTTTMNAFVAPVMREHPPPATVLPNGAAAGGNVPTPLTRIVGRDDVIAALAAQLARRRFLTIVGPGGIGKMWPSDRAKIGATRRDD